MILVDFDNSTKAQISTIIIKPSAARRPLAVFAASGVCRAHLQQLQQKNSRRTAPGKLGDSRPPY